MQDEIKEQEKLLKDMQKKEREISGNLIPDLLDEIGLSELKLPSGEKVIVKRDYAAGITGANYEFCMAWLKDNGHESLIKHDVVAKLKKGDDEEHKALVAKLLELGVNFDDKETVHPGTLKAFVREQIEGGVDFPQEQFSVFPVRKTTIK